MAGVAAAKVALGASMPIVKILDGTADALPVEDGEFDAALARR